MDLPAIIRAKRTIVEDLRDSLAFSKNAADTDDRIYGLAFVSRDCHDYTELYIANEKRLSTQNANAEQDSKRMLNKWYFGAWEGPGDWVDTSELLKSIPWEPSMDSPHYSALRKSIYLWALIHCLKEVVEDGKMCHRNQPIVAFCSVIDSLDAPWVERETARLINPPEVFQGFLSEQEMASKAWYGDRPVEVSLFEQYFRQLLGT